MVKKNTGRKKIELVKMKNETNLQVTFSKRRSGLFKKASELCTLCGVDIALIVFSPGGKVFSYGHPNIDLLLHRFEEWDKNSPLGYTINYENFESIPNSNLQNLNEMLSKVLTAKKEENAKKQKKKIIKNEILEKYGEQWYQNSPEEFNLAQAIQMKNTIEKLMKTFDNLHPQFNPAIINYQNLEIESSSNAASGYNYGKF